MIFRTYRSIHKLFLSLTLIDLHATLAKRHWRSNRPSQFAASQIFVTRDKITFFCTYQFVRFHLNVAGKPTIFSNRNPPRTSHSIPPTPDHKCIAFESQRLGIFPNIFIFPEQRENKFLVFFNRRTS